MLSEELAGRPYVKAEYRRALLRQLDGRTEAAVEQKHRNISAVLDERGMPHIRGYKPLGHYQQLLLEVVLEKVAALQSFDRKGL
jgi:hypothetical protein